MNLKIFVGAIFIELIFFTHSILAYDLPKVKTELPALELPQENLPVDSPQRISIDKNLIFIAQFKGYAYYLDKYSIQIVKDNSGARIFRQRIYPVGENISPKDAKATAQDFFTDGKNIYNSTRRRENLSDLTNDTEKNFLLKCFSVGYFYAFNEVF